MNAFPSETEKPSIDAGELLETAEALTIAVGFLFEAKDGDQLITNACMNRAMDGIGHLINLAIYDVRRREAQADNTRALARYIERRRAGDAVSAEIAA